MKTISQLKEQVPVYLNDWAGKDKIQLISDFDDIYMSKEEYEAVEAPYNNKEHWEQKKIEMSNAIKRWEPINILFATYSYQDYSGDAFVLFERDGKLFEVNGSHCSCYGLEGQFEPEETSVEALAHRLIEGKMGQDSYCGNEYGNELKQFLGV